MIWRGDERLGDGDGPPWGACGHARRVLRPAKAPGRNEALAAGIAHPSTSIHGMQPVPPFFPRAILRRHRYNSRRGGQCQLNRFSHWIGLEGHFAGYRPPDGLRRSEHDGSPVLKRGLGVVVAWVSTGFLGA